MKQLFAKLVTTATVLATPGMAFAQFQNDGVQRTFNPGDLTQLQRFLTPIRPDPGSTLTLTGLVLLILNYLIFFAAVLAIIYLIWAGIQYITAGTDDEKAKKARSGIYNAIIGIVIIVLSYAIIQYVARLAGSVANEATGGSIMNNGGWRPPLSLPQ